MEYTPSTTRITTPKEGSYVPVVSSADIMAQVPPNDGAGGSTQVKGESKHVNQILTLQKDVLRDATVDHAKNEGAVGADVGVFIALTFIADTLGHLLEYGNKFEALDTVRQMFGLGGARKAAIARQKDATSTQLSMS